MSETICDSCGHPVQPGDWPFCSKDGGPHARGAAAVQDDTLTGGARWMHNLGPEPMWIERRSELKQIMQERGLVFAERNNYSKEDKSPYATRTRLRPGQRDPFVSRA